MKGRYPSEEDQRTLPNAGDSVDEQLAKLIRERYPEVQFSIHIVREWKEQQSFVGEPKSRIVVTAPVRGKPTELDITAEMRTACEMIVPPLTEKMIDLLSRVEPEFQERVRNNIILAGGSSLISGLAESLERHLVELGGGHISVVDDPMFAGSDGGLAIARDATNADWEELSV